MKATFSSSSKSQKRTLLIVSAFALSMITLQVIDMAYNRPFQSVSANSTIESTFAGNALAGSNLLPTVEVVAPGFALPEAVESIAVEDWMLNSDSWLINENTEPEIMIEDWMFDSNYPSIDTEESPALEAWMYSSEGWISTVNHGDVVEIQNWMCDATAWF